MALEPGNYVRVSTKQCTFSCLNGHPDGHRRMDGAVGKFEADLKDHDGHTCFFGVGISRKATICEVCAVTRSTPATMATGHSFMVHGFNNKATMYLFRSDELEDLGVSDFNELVALATERELSYATIGASPEGERQRREVRHVNCRCF